MTDPDHAPLWSDFLAVWPPERVREMTVEEYTNPNRDDAFIYWIEKRLEKLGSIWGGSAFKFGIYCRDNTDAKEPVGGRVWGNKYAWLKKFGATEQEAFATVRSRLVQVIDAVEEGNIARVDEVDLAPVLKWKVAFLYQDRAKPVLLPIFKKEMLFFHYRAIDSSAKLGSTTYHVMYETLLERHHEAGDVLEIGKMLWEANDAAKNRAPRAWAVPLAWMMQDPGTIEALCAKAKVEPEDVAPLLDSILAAADVSEGDRIALLVENQVRALGTLTNVEPGQFAWDQVAVGFPSGLAVHPTVEVRELNAAEWQEIWSHHPGLATGPGAAPAGRRYWKIAPGRNAVAWPAWKEQGIVAIGWPELGDLTTASKADFDKRAASCAEAHGYSNGMSQVWVFRNIQPGDRLVANHGKRTVVGIGTVVSGYVFDPGTHTVEGEDYPHQLRVDWDDTTQRAVDESGWGRTLIELSKEEFDGIWTPAAAQEARTRRPDPLPGPCDPQNIILYGPPGTGKTYGTVRRALELILGADKLQGLGEKGLMALFREHQARGQIEFVTFHQAYGYEEFVEGIRPVLDAGAGQDVRYELHDGVFKRIALRAAAEGLLDQSETLAFEELWSALVANLTRDGAGTAKSSGGKTYQLELSSQGNIVALPCELDIDGDVDSVAEKGQVASKENARLYWENRDELGPEPEKFTYEKTTQVFARERGSAGGNHYTALWIVYCQLLALSQGTAARKHDLVDTRARVQQALDKPTAGIASFSFNASTRQHVLIIDEINRGNVSRILGELITLLEPDKRLGARSELKLPLSYSPTHRFAVPPNLHVLGTMNTADRSIALMDVALRRRFRFEELMPSSQVIRDVLGSRTVAEPLVNLVVDLFEVLNARIRFLYDRDHQLGHSYFLDVGDLEGLRRVLVDRVVPLLQEYFYGAWDKISMVLGCPYGESGEARRRGHVVTKVGGRTAYAAPIVAASGFSEMQTLGFDHDDYEDRVDFTVVSDFQLGRLSAVALARTLLGVLEITTEDFDSRLAALTTVPGVGPSASVVEGESAFAVAVA